MHNLDLEGGKPSPQLPPEDKVHPENISRDLWAFATRPHRAFCAQSKAFVKANMSLNKDKLGLSKGIILLARLPRNLGFSASSFPPSLDTLTRN